MGFYRQSIGLIRFVWMSVWVSVLVLCLILMPISSAWAQTQALLLKQETDQGEIRPLSEQERSQLNDPMFNLVLKDHAETTSLTKIQQLLKSSDQSLFAVDEHIVDAATKVNNRAAVRRAVLTLRDDRDDSPETDLDQNVFFSLLFNPETLPLPGFLEAMGWDESQGQFNYYKLDQGRGETAPTWKFRGSSAGADLLSSSARQGTCMECHINGGPVMKELLLPWNNWHSFSAEVTYLSGGKNSWPIAQGQNSPFRNLQGAETLEGSDIFPTISRFNDRRIQALLSADGKTITDALRLLKPLFVTTEFNIISSDTLSGLHPFGQSSGATAQTVSIPSSTFLNANLISSTLGLFDAQNFSGFASLTGREYDDLVRRSDTQFNGQKPADTHFAWFAPEPSFIDTDFVSQLVQRDLVPAKFVAAVLALDLETPVLSPVRAKLWSSKVIPSQFKVGENSDLIPQVIKNLERLNPAANTAEALFLAVLRSPDPVATLQNRINQYVSREQKALGASGAVRTNELRRLYRRLLDQRQAVLANANFKHLDETGGKLLFPSGNGALLKADPVDQRPTLRQGDRGDAVVQLQRRLKDLGFLSGAADGDFGLGTQRAVIAAQQKLGLTADGVVGPTTWAALDKATPAQPTQPTQPTLRQGDRGDAVVQLQQRLRAFGFLTAPADGDFGPLTRSAVIAAQRRFGLDPDGVVGPSTWAALSRG